MSSGRGDRRGEEIECDNRRRGRGGREGGREGGRGALLG